MRKGRGSNVVALGKGQRDQIRQLCRHEIDRMDQADVEAIEAKDVASAVARRLDRSQRSPALVFFAAIEGIAQIARGELRGAHGLPDLDDQEQLEAFGEELNDRYSIKRPGWDVTRYVLRESISKAEFTEQVLPMLKKRSEQYARHYDLARAWNESRE